VVDSASLEVSRRFRRVTPAQAGGARETDRMDSGRRLGMLMRFPPGERKGWSVVHVPSVRAEAERHSHREMMALKKERTRHRNRIYGLLSSQGVMLEVDATFMETTETVRLWNDSPLPGICGWAWKGSTRDGVVAAADWSIGKGTELNTLGAGIRIPCAHLSLLMSGFE